MRWFALEQNPLSAAPRPSFPRILLAIVLASHSAKETSGSEPQIRLATAELGSVINVHNAQQPSDVHSKRSSAHDLNASIEKEQARKSSAVEVLTDGTVRQYKGTQHDWSPHGDAIEESIKKHGAVRVDLDVQRSAAWRTPGNHDDAVVAQSIEAQRPAKAPTERSVGIRASENINHESFSDNAATEGYVEKHEAVQKGIEKHLAVRSSTQAPKTEEKGVSNPRQSTARTEGSSTTSSLEHQSPSPNAATKYFVFGWPWNWIVFGAVALVVLVLMLCKGGGKSKKRRVEKWQEVEFMDAGLAKQSELRRQVAKAEGWDKHFPPKDVPSSLCSGISYYRGTPNRKHLEEKARLMCQKGPRFGAIMTGDSIRCTDNPMLWQPVDKLDMKYHIVEHPKVVSKHDRDELVNALCHKDAVLDSDKPLWRLHLIPCEQDDNAAIFSFCHAIGDAVSIMPVMLGTFASTKEGKPFELFSEDIRKAFQAKVPPGYMLAAHWCLRFLKALRHLLSAFKPESWAHETRLVCHNPERFLDHPFSGPLSMNPDNQRLLNFPRIPISYVKALKNKAKVKEGMEHCTFNDVLCSAYVGMLRRYCEELGNGGDLHNHILKPGEVATNLVFRGAQLHNQDAMAQLALGHDLHLGNSAELWIADLGIAMGQATAEERLKHLAQAFWKDKNSGRPYAAHLAFKIVLSLTNDLKDLVNVMAQQQTKLTFSFSAVAFPSEHVYIDGLKIKEIRAVYHSNIPGVVALSYADDVFMSANICAGALRGWERLPHLLLEELKALGEALDVSTEALTSIRQLA